MCQISGCRKEQKQFHFTPIFLSMRNKINKYINKIIQAFHTPESKRNKHRCTKKFRNNDLLCRTSKRGKPDAVSGQTPSPHQRFWRLQSATVPSQFHTASAIRVTDNTPHHKQRPQYDHHDVRCHMTSCYIDRPLRPLPQMLWEEGVGGGAENRRAERSHWRRRVNGWCRVKIERAQADLRDVSDILFVFWQHPVLSWHWSKQKSTNFCLGLKWNDILFSCPYQVAVLNFQDKRLQYVFDKTTWWHTLGTERVHLFPDVSIYFGLFGRKQGDTLWRAQRDSLFQ